MAEQKCIAIVSPLRRALNRSLIGDPRGYRWFEAIARSLDVTF
jgi:hypothetical protein